MGEIYLIKIKEYSKGKMTKGRETLHTYPFYFKSWGDAYKRIQEISPAAVYVGDERKGCFVGRERFATIFFVIEVQGLDHQYFR